MTVKQVEAHIDSCDGIPPSSKKAASNQNKPATRPERLPHPHYSGLKDTALRKKLADQGISSTGSRQLMERRYTEWVTLWNANCDSKSPKGKSELRRELDIWERTQGGKANTAGREQTIGAQIRDKDFDGKAWAEKNDEAFRELIAKARMKPVVKTVTSEPAPQEGDGVGGPSHTTLIPPQLDSTNGEAREAESQIQYHAPQEPPLDGAALANYAHNQSIPTFDDDKNC